MTAFFATVALSSKVLPILLSKTILSQDRCSSSGRQWKWTVYAFKHLVERPTIKSQRHLDISASRIATVRSCLRSGSLEVERSRRYAFVELLGRVLKTFRGKKHTCPSPSRVSPIHLLSLAHTTAHDYLDTRRVSFPSSIQSHSGGEPVKTRWYNRARVA